MAATTLPYDMIVKICKSLDFDDQYPTAKALLPKEHAAEFKDRVAYMSSLNESFAKDVLAIKETFVFKNGTSLVESANFDVFDYALDTEVSNLSDDEIGTPSTGVHKIATWEKLHIAGHAGDFHIEKISYTVLTANEVAHVYLDIKNVHGSTSKFNVTLKVTMTCTGRCIARGTRAMSFDATDIKGIFLDEGGKLVATTPHEDGDKFWVEYADGTKVQRTDPQEYAMYKIGVSTATMKHILV